MAAPASAAARHSSAICSGVTGTADPGAIGAPPVTAQVMIVSELTTFSCKFRWGFHRNGPHDPHDNQMLCCLLWMQQRAMRALSLSTKSQYWPPAISRGEICDFA